MRIAQIVPSLETRHGGPSVSVPKLSAALARLGHQVDLLTTGAETAPSEAKEAGLSVRHFPRARPDWICASPALKRHLASERYDIVHSHGLWLRTTHYAAQCAERLGVPHVISPRGMLNRWAWNHHRWKKELALRFIHPKAVDAARGWHATSRIEAEDIAALGFTQPVCLAANGVEPPTPAQATAATAYWKEACPDAFSRPTALFYSRFHHKKRVLELIDLWTQHAPRRWMLMLVGIPQEYSVSQIRGYVLQNSASDRVQVFDGSDAPAPYPAASLFLLPSHSENFGMVVAEALAWGLPVLVTDTTPWKAINDTDYGWCGPWEEYKDALLASLALGEETLRERGEAARAWAVREYSWDCTAATLAGFYESLLH